MLLRLVSGALHPFTQVGYRLEFGSDLLVATGIAQAAVHASQAFAYLPPDKFADASPTNGSHPVGKGRQPRSGPSVLSLLRQIYDSPKLTPVLPYDPDALFSKRVKDFMEGGTRLSELHHILGQFDPGSTPEALDDRAEELVFISTMLAFGTGKPHRKPRVDFFPMHLVTSSLFLPSYLKSTPNMEHKRALLRTFLQPWGSIIMVRGRPRVDAKLLMSYTDNPLPPNPPPPKPQPAALGGEAANPWLAIVADAIHAPESRTHKRFARFFTEQPGMAHWPRARS
ncbi:hypothetical protein JB92DRAFT_3144988 [Gautieria morchelliformis]|nr:hypothetical protein JB92DRAFT_3144988 [Gautieria morchelliformis]